MLSDFSYVVEFLGYLLFLYLCNCSFLSVVVTQVPLQEIRLSPRGQHQMKVPGESRNSKCLDQK